MIDRDILRFDAETVIDYYILQFIKNQGCMLKNILKPFRCIILCIKNYILTTTIVTYLYGIIFNIRSRKNGDEILNKYF